MDEQKIYDKVATHLLTQKKKASKSGKCKFRTKDSNGRTLQCAIGCLIPYKLYRKSMDNPGLPAHQLIQNYPLVAELIGADPKSFKDRCFLDDLQGIHDSVKAHQWFKALYSFARNKNLSVEVLKQINNKKFTQLEREIDVQI